MKDRIWELFILRVSQEERVMSHEKAARCLTGCYAVYAVAAAVLSALYPAASWTALLTLMTVFSALLTVFLCVNPFGQRLKLIRRDLAELEALHTAAEQHELDERTLGSRMQMIVSSGAAADAQDRRAYERIKDRSEKRQAAWEGRPAHPKRLFGYEKFLYWFYEIAGIVFFTVMLLLPVAGFVVAACGLL